MQKIVRTAEPKLSEHPEYSSKEEMIRGELMKMTSNHCAYTDRLIDENPAVLDQFKPKDDSWENLYVVHPITNLVKRDNYHELLIRPDEPDYRFDEYFDLDFTKHTIEINRSANSENQERAALTIEILNLNHTDLVEERRYALKKYLEQLEKFRSYEEDMLAGYKQKSSNLFLEDRGKYSINVNDSFRFYIGRASEKYRVKKNEYIDKINISKYFCIEDFNVSNLKDKKEIYFLGENGDGKTIALQAIVLALKALKDKFVYKYIDTSVNNFTIQIQNEQGEEYNYDNDITCVHTDVYAYGVGRLRNHKEYDDKGYLSLFDYDTYLTNPVDWFKEVERLQLKGIGKLKLETVKELFKEILGDKVTIEETSEGDYIFKEKGATLKFSQLSDGYRSVMIWLSDLLSRLSKNQPEVTKLEDYKAIVLVDEIGSYLHPRWEYEVVRKLRKLFPKIQWFFTTHSPVVALGASEDAVFYKLYKEDGITKVSEPFHAEVYANRLLSNFVTSPLFNLDTARPAAFDELKHEDLETGNYLYRQIHRQVKERIKNKPLQEEEIRNVINEILDKLEKAGQI